MKSSRHYLILFSSTFFFFPYNLLHFYLCIISCSFSFFFVFSFLPIYYLFTLFQVIWKNLSPILNSLALSPTFLAINSILQSCHFFISHSLQSLIPFFFPSDLSYLWFHSFLFIQGIWKDFNPLMLRSKTPPKKKKDFLNMTLNCILWWGSSCGALQSVKSSFH